MLIHFWAAGSKKTGRGRVLIAPPRPRPPVTSLPPTGSHLLNVPLPPCGSTDWQPSLYHMGLWRDLLSDFLKVASEWLSWNLNQHVRFLNHWLNQSHSEENTFWKTGSPPWLTEVVKGISFGAGGTCIQTLPHRARHTQALPWLSSEWPQRAPNSPRVSEAPRTESGVKRAPVSARKGHNKNTCLPWSSKAVDLLERGYRPPEGL